MNSVPQINYSSRDFKSLRSDLIAWAKSHHPDTMTFFNDASPDIMYLEMCAYVGDMLSYYTDKTFNETFRTTAQARTSLVRIANDLGFFELGSTPAATQVTITLNGVPFKTDQTSGVNYPDSDYLVNIQAGMKLQADNGVFFEVLEDVNFADERNRKEIMNLNSNNQLTNYTIQKFVDAYAGQTKIQRYYVDVNNSIPFLNIIINDTDITEVLMVTSVAGNQQVAPNEIDFNNPENAWYEVRDLTQTKMFMEVNPNDTTNSTVKTGEMVSIPRRFITRRDENNVVSITFGNNSVDSISFKEAIQTTIDGSVDMTSILGNSSLGNIPAANTTLFIKYRVGGGAATNTQVGQINKIAFKQFYPGSPTATSSVLQSIRGGMTVINNVVATGGKDVPSIEEIRNTSGRIFASQDRAVTYIDLKALIETMPAKYGRPFRMGFEEIKPGVANYTDLKVYVENQLSNILAQDTQVGRQQIVSTIKSYLSNYETTAQTNTSTLNGAPSLWLGEKARLYLVSQDSNGGLVTLQKQTDGSWISPQSILKTNIANFLTNKRVQGDWLDIVDGKIINFQLEFTILADKNNKQGVLTQCLQTLQNYFAITNWEFNQPIFIANVETALQNLPGVINVVDIKFYNIFGTDIVSGKTYQPMEIGRYRNNLTVASGGANRYEMISTNNVIQGYNDCIFECKYPDHDLIGKVI